MTRRLYLACSAMAWVGPQGDGCFVADINGRTRVEPLGLDGKGGLRNPVVVDHANPDRLWAATARQGVWRSDDAGRTWQPVNDGLVYLEIWSLVQHPRTGTLFAGTGPAAIWRSDDGGDHWEECRHLRTLPSQRDWTFPGPPFMAHVKNIGLFTPDPNLVFGAVEEGWCVRSTDGGATWENLRDGVEHDCHTANVMPDDPNVVVCTAGTGVYRSKDGGETFVESCQGLERRYMTPLVVHPDRPRRLFAAAAEVPPPFWRRPAGASGAFYRSDDQGETWEKLSGGELPDWFEAAPRSVAVDPENPDAFFVGMTDGTVWMSDDGGDSFHCILKDLPGVTGITVAPG